MPAIQITGIFYFYGFPEMENSVRFFESDKLHKQQHLLPFR